MAYEVLNRPKGKPRERLLLIGGFSEALYDSLQGSDLLVEEVLDGAEALRCAPEREYGVVLCSLRMEKAWGLDVMDAILRVDPFASVIISTHEKSPKVVVEAMRRGAVDYVIEPYQDIEEVWRVLERAIRRRSSLLEGKRLQDALQEEENTHFEGLIGRSRVMRELYERIRMVAPTSSPVLIEGSSGTGKELVARAIHNRSERRHGPFVAVHCGAIAENLLESELFGHEKGAFTGADSTRVGVFEEAHGGTLFLDEIGLTSQACQAKLLRVLETGEIRRVGASRELKVDVRVVSATNEPLQQLVDSRRFRQDLLYRLNVVGLRTPALIERKEDVPLLSYHFAQRYAREAEKPFKAFSEEALDALMACPFPGNVRELRNIVERSVVFCRDPIVRISDLSLSLQAGAISDVSSDVKPSTSDLMSGIQVLDTATENEPGLDHRLKSLERSLISQALSACGGNRSHAAKLLKIKRTTLLQKMARHGLRG